MDVDGTGAVDSGCAHALASCCIAVNSASGVMGRSRRRTPVQSWTAAAMAGVDSCGMSAAVGSGSPGSCRSSAARPHMPGGRRVRYWGTALSRASSARHEHSRPSTRAEAAATSTARPGDQPGVVAAVGQRVRPSRSRRSTRSASGSRARGTARGPSTRRLLDGLMRDRVPSGRSMVGQASCHVHRVRVLPSRAMIVTYLLNHVV